MTNPDERTVLLATLDICKQNNGAASAYAVAQRFGVEEAVAVLELLPPIAKYFEKVRRGDDGVVSVRQPTEDARRFIGPS